MSSGKEPSWNIELECQGIDLEVRSHNKVSKVPAGAIGEREVAD